MQKDALYRVWFQCAVGYSNVYLEKILQKYTTVEHFYRLGEKEWASCGLFQGDVVRRLKDASLEKAEKIVKECEETGIWMLFMDDPDYPERLKNIPNAPVLLYGKGTLPKIDREVCIAMVGTRTATVYGVDIATQLAHGIAQAGGIVVSGGALGIDTASHNGALRAGGKTIVVLGCGINYPYLKQNIEMREMAAQNGAVLSEYPPREEPHPYYFPLRNRIISGLSVATLVVEAGKRSGSLITAQIALEQGRDVLAVPGSILSEKSNGTNALLQQGAKPVSNVQDILEEYTELFRGKLKMESADARLHWESTKKHPTREDFFVDQLNFEEENLLAEPKKPVKSTKSTRAEKSEKPAKPVAQTKPAEEAPAKKTVPSKSVSPTPEVSQKAPEEPTISSLPKKSASSKGKPEPLSPSDRELLSEQAVKIVENMTKTPAHIDDLAAMAGLSVQNALAAVTELELMGFIQSHSGKRFSRL